jgi:hypothetical protein
MYGNMHPVLLIMAYPRCRPSMDLDRGFVYHPIDMDKEFSDHWILAETRNRILRAISLTRLFVAQGALDNDTVEMYPWSSPSVSIEYPEAAS